MTSYKKSNFNYSIVKYMHILIILQASYQNDEKMMFLGRENLTAYETENAPYVIWFGVDAKIYYTLIMVCKY